MIAGLVTNYGNQITLYLGHQSKSKSQHFAIDVILEHIPLFGTCLLYTSSLSPRYENSNIMAEIKSEETSEKKSLNFIEQIVENDLKEGKDVYKRQDYCKANTVVRNTLVYF